VSFHQDEFAAMLPEINERIIFHYPETSHLFGRRQAKFRRREIIVRQIRDLVRSPLSVEEFLRRPMIQRGRYLIVGTDVQSGQLRQFYEASFEERLRELPLRVGYYRKFEMKPEFVLEDEFNTPCERTALARAIARGEMASYEGLRVGIFADDLRLVLPNF
jgi:hypothetical protein